MGYSLWDCKELDMTEHAPITYMWNLQNKTNEYNRTERLTYIENKLGVTSEEREGKQGKIGVGD